MGGSAPGRRRPSRYHGWTPCDDGSGGSDPARPYRRRKRFSKRRESNGKALQAGQQADLPA
ncbi:hypothetical protein SBD_2882 [Streptomyces bottropensis ATCC 25435]|uniref:Uncharacterized protein n=1 Tax=Streptomyces bottropensis ATCC 25435 TaxID=1054862 RepID=M3FTK0_9ACTN|nr:hypothetical protein SBD_2882 [Streptomyces bottropensis ATCC 25435]